MQSKRGSMMNNITNASSSINTAAKYNLTNSAADKI